MTGRPPRRLTRWHPAGVIELEPEVGEKEWMYLVLDDAQRCGWARHYHTFDSRRSPSGFPDLVLLHPGFRRVIFAELKVDAGRPTTEQADWINDLRACGQEAYVWRPKDRPEIQALLASRRRP